MEIDLFSNFGRLDVERGWCEEIRFSGKGAAEVVIGTFMDVLVLTASASNMGLYTIIELANVLINNPIKG